MALGFFAVQEPAAFALDQADGCVYGQGIGTPLNL